MMLNIVWIVVGVVLVLWGADRLTDGAVTLAKRMNVSEIVIGLTIVAMGTSMPEFCVSLVSALKGTPDLAVGNVVGSNIFNAMLIVGVAAMVAPMTILHSTVKRDIPFALLASVALLVMCLDGDVSRVDALILMALFLLFMYVTLKGAHRAPEADDAMAVYAEERRDAEVAGRRSVWMSLLWLVVGLACLIFGSNLFVDGATQIATLLGVSDAVIGLTIVAGGTSLPELATSVVSAKKGQSGIAIGNVLGSNVFNILAILGITGVISPMQLSGITMVDLGVMALSMTLLWLFSYTKYTIARWEGALLTALFLGYITYLVMGAV